MLILLALVSAAYADPDHVVSTTTGPVRGFHMTSRDGHDYLAFTKIPYAKPPVGDLRLAPPEAMDPWTEVYNATEQLPICMQIPIYDPNKRHTLIGTDDCLYLNVFTPSTAGSRAIMIYTHGGGWRSGAPGPGPYTRSKYLMDFDVVLVIPNYRLGGLGFLSTEDGVISGNFGMKDQAAAIAWISANAAAFGGDPNRITVFGESAGGASAHYHLLSPLSRDLIQGSISQSGVAHALWSLGTPGTTRWRTQQLAKSLECDISTSEAILSCLRTKTAKEITEAERQFTLNDYDPPIVYPPVIESSDVEKPFLTDSPYNIPVDKPWITGYNSGEGGFKIVSLKSDPTLVEKTIAEANETLPIYIMYENATTHADDVTKALRKRYYDVEDFYKGVYELFTDAFFLWPLEEAVSRATKDPWVYVFDHRGKISSTDLLSGDKDFGNLGVSHTDELLYLFNFEDEIPDMKTDKDQEVSRRLCGLWTNFAKTGKPTADDSWTTKGTNVAYLNIGSDGNQMRDALEPEELKFWKSLPLRDKMFAKGI